ncbi:MAG: glycosyltransferase family 4 protein [Cyclobacteriaceae bacterium]|nr:glycosyltransferase family 4 protein [Cyclobacteriaceae bacterium]
MQKICHLSTAHPRNDIRIFLKECGSLASKYSTNLIVADGHGYEEVNKIKIYDVGRPTGRIQRFIRTVYQIYHKALTLDCEIYHFHDPDFIFAGVLLKIKGKKIIYDIHEDVPRDIYSKEYLGILRRPLSFIVEKIENWAAKRFTALITATPFIEARFLKVNVNTWCINNYPLMSEVIREPKQEIKSNKIAYSGLISKIRGIEEIIESLTYLPVQLELAGQFENEKLRTRLMALPGWKKVNYYGLLNRSQMKHMLATCFAGIITYYPEPNHVNAQPNKIFEYMSSGLPVICSNFEAWMEIINCHNCGIGVDPICPKSIAKGIESLYNHAQKSTEMGRRGLDAVRRTYNWDIEEKKLVHIYELLLN